MSDHYHPAKLFNGIFQMSKPAGLRIHLVHLAAGVPGHLGLPGHRTNGRCRPEIDRSDSNDSNLVSAESALLATAEASLLATESTLVSSESILTTSEAALATLRRRAALSRDGSDANCGDDGELEHRTIDAGTCRGDCTWWMVRERQSAFFYTGADVTFCGAM